MPTPADASFALCLTHDVDRPYKTYQSLYYALVERDPSHLRTLLSGENPYWQFEEIMALEADLGVRSAFYFLNEPHLLHSQGPRKWLRPRHWIEHFGRYDVTSEDVRSVVRALDDGGWEVGLHGSFHSPDDRERLAEEKRVIESMLDGEVGGVRQHHLRLAPDTWRHHADLGLRYDASLGSSTEVGFGHGYHPIRPFPDEEFVVFPLTAMEVALPDPGERFESAWRTCERLLDRAGRHGAVMTVLWHPRYFNEREFPGYRALYRRLVEEAQSRGAWVGPPGEYLDAIDPVEDCSSLGPSEDCSSLGPSEDCSSLGPSEDCEPLGPSGDCESLDPEGVVPDPSGDVDASDGLGGVDGTDPEESSDPVAVDR